MNQMNLNVFRTDFIDSGFYEKFAEKRVLVLQQIFPCLIIRFDSIVKKYYIFFNNT